jgi:membrane fusion protein (multidrug efflux system)
MRFLVAMLFITAFFQSSSTAFAGNVDMSEMDCFIEPHFVVKLGSEIPGVIESIEVERGDFVKKGQVLVKLAAGVERATVDLDRARLDFAVRDDERSEPLHKEGIIPISEMDKIETNLRISQSELKKAEEELKRRIILSPIDGVVVERLMSAGERVENQPILKLAQLDPLNVEVIAPAILFGSVKVGDRIEVKPEKPLKGVYTGYVKIVDRVIDAASSTFGFRIELPNKDYAIPSGLKCHIRFLGHK